MAVRGDVFADNFIRGFSFVDDIKRRNKNDKLVAKQLAEQKDERAFQRRRQNAADSRVDTLFDQQQEDRTGRLSDEANAEEGDTFALQNPDATIEELSQFPNSPEAIAAIKRKNQDARIGGALKTATGIGRAGAQTQGNPSLSDAVAGQQQAASGQPAQNAPGLPTMTPEERANHDELLGRSPDPNAPGFQFADSKGQGGQERVSEEEFNKFSKTFQDKSFLGKIGDVAGGQFAQYFRAASDVVGGTFNAPGRIRGAITGEDIDPATQNTGQEVTGEVNLPSEFTTEEEFETLRANGASLGEVNEAAARNFAITADYEKRGRQPHSMVLEPAFSRQGAVLQSSDKARNTAIAIEKRVVNDAQAFLDPSTQEGSQLSQLALEAGPAAATVKYLEDRATLQDANPALSLEMDRAMLPVVNQAVVDMQAETAASDPDSPKGRQQRAALGNLQHSRDQIAKGQPSINQQANIKPAGVKVGDQPRVNDVVDTIYDPDRVVPTQFSNSAVSTAATVASRITPNKRLNDAQTNSLAVLAQAGWIDKPTALSVMMTGAWPPGKDPNAVKKIQSANNVTYGLTEGGEYFVIQDHSKGNKGVVPNREFNEERIGWITGGITSQFPNMEEGNVNALASIVYDDPSYYRSRYTVTSQEDMRRLGVHIAQSKTIHDANFRDLEDGFFFKGNTKDAPTTSEIMADPDMRARLATDLELNYSPVPDVKDLDGIDDEEVRQYLRDGRAGPVGAENADQYTQDEALEVVMRNKLMELDAAGRLQIEADGSITILPEQAE
jgi:hypothetical protein